MNGNTRSHSESSGQWTRWTDAPGSKERASVGCRIFEVDFSQAAPEAPTSFRSIEDVVQALESDPLIAEALAEERKSFSKTLHEGSATLSSLRLARGWSQAQLAERLDMKQPNIARLERGGPLPALPTFRKLANVLDITMEELAKALDNQGAIAARQTR